MRINKIIIFLLLCIFTFSCNSSSTNTSDVTNNYILITTAIKTSKESRLKFQKKFAIVLDSFLLKDNPLIKLDELKHLLEDAKSENKKAENLVLEVNEIDSTLRYKEKALDMFKFLDRLYNYDYPEIFKIMESTIKDKKSLIRKIIIPSSDTLKIKAADVITTAKLIIDKYDIKLVAVTD